MTDIFVVIYLDDILIFSNSLEEHQVHVRRVFIIAHLHEGFAYAKVFVLKKTVGLGVIWGNLDMMDALFLG